MKFPDNFSLGKFESESNAAVAGWLAVAAHPLHSGAAPGA